MARSLTFLRSLNPWNVGPCPSPKPCHLHIEPSVALCKSHGPLFKLNSLPEVFALSPPHTGCGAQLQAESTCTYTRFSVSVRLCPVCHQYCHWQPSAPLFSSHARLHFWDSRNCQRGEGALHNCPLFPVLLRHGMLWLPIRSGFGPQNRTYFPVGIVLFNLSTHGPLSLPYGIPAKRKH